MVPDPTWFAQLTDREKLFHWPDYDDFRQDKEGYVARCLQWSARECLAEGLAPGSLKTNLAHIERIGRLARELRKLLLAPNKFRPTFSDNFLGVELIAMRFPPEVVEGKETYEPLYAHEMIIELLDTLVGREAYVLETFERWHSEDEFNRYHHPAFVRFVDHALGYWDRWTNSPAGGSKAGGPAARFLCTAANPFLHFAERELGLKLRRAGDLTEESAGDLIARLHDAHPFPE